MLPKIIDAASDDGLRDALNKHLDETRGHVDRLEQAFVDEAAGKMRDTFGHAKRKVGEAAEHIGKTVKK